MTLNKGDFQALKRPFPQTFAVPFANSFAVKKYVAQHIYEVL